MENNFEVHRQLDLEFRCPQCSKLYKVSDNLIHSAQPQFDCSACHIRFTFEYPPPNPANIRTKQIRSIQVKKLEESSRTGTLKPCPKCLALNPRHSVECYKCRVVFSKIESLVKESVPSARPSLIRAWQDILSDYNNIKKHVEFVDRCEELQALPFALKKYNEIKEVQPHDKLAGQMINSMILRVMHNNLAWMQKVPWANISRVAPLAIGLTLILAGLLKPGWRNLVGGGVSLVVLNLGFVYFIKGRIFWKDFWRD